jgi:hypothetical protein
MKKLVCILAMGAIVLGFASCKRECTCTVTLKDGSSTSYSQGKMTDSECGKKVDELEKTYSQAGADLKNINCVNI